MHEYKIERLREDEPATPQADHDNHAVRELKKQAYKSPTQQRLIEAGVVKPRSKYR